MFNSHNNYMKFEESTKPTTTIMVSIVTIMY